MRINRFSLENCKHEYSPSAQMEKKFKIKVEYILEGLNSKKN